MFLFAYVGSAMHHGSGSPPRRFSSSSLFMHSVSAASAASEGKRESEPGRDVHQGSLHFYKKDYLVTTHKI